MSLQSISASSSNGLSSGSSSSGDTIRAATGVGNDATNGAGAGVGAKRDAAAMVGKERDTTDTKAKAERDEQVTIVGKSMSGEVTKTRVGSNVKTGKQERVVVVIDDDDTDDDGPLHGPKRRKLNSDGDAKTAGLTDSDGPPEQVKGHHVQFGGLRPARGSELAVPKAMVSPAHQELQEPTSSQPSSAPDTLKPHRTQPQQPLIAHLPTQDIIDLNINTSETAETTEPPSQNGPGGRKDWTAGMYLDFCLTLQRSFDFDAFANKYGIPVAKVLDRFQALVLHPVMNHNEKGRMRVVEGGRARVKEWYDAKKETKKRMREEREEAEE